MVLPSKAETTQSPLSAIQREKKLYDAFKSAPLAKNEDKHGHPFSKVKDTSKMILACISVLVFVIALYGFIIPEFLKYFSLPITKDGEVTRGLWILVVEIVLLVLIAWRFESARASYLGQEFGDAIITKMEPSLRPTSGEIEYVIHRMEQNLYGPPSILSWIVSIFTYNVLVIVLLGLLGSTTAARIGISLGITVEGEERYVYFIVGSIALALIWLKYLLEHLQQKRIVLTLEYLQNLKNREIEEEKEKIKQEKARIEKIIQKEIESRGLLKKQINLQKSKIKKLEQNKIYQLSNKLSEIMSIITK